MMPTEIELVDAAAAIYNPQPGQFDKIIQVDPTAPLIGVSHGDSYDLIVARGSQTAEDWLRDFQSELGVAVRGYEVLGMLPHGFAMHMADTYAAVRAELRGVPVYASAHSLGCPEIVYQCAAHMLAKGTVAHIALFESPKPGTPVLTAFMALTPINSYWNQGDPVPDAPEPVPIWLPWETVRAPIRFDLGPAPAVEHPFIRHEIAWCQAAVRQMAGASVITIQAGKTP